MFCKVVITFEFYAKLHCYSCIAILLFCRYNGVTLYFCFSSRLSLSSAFFLIFSFVSCVDPEFFDVSVVFLLCCISYFCLFTCLFWPVSSFWGSRSCILCFFCFFFSVVYGREDGSYAFLLCFFSASCCFLISPGCTSCYVFTVLLSSACSLSWFFFRLFLLCVF